MAGLEGLVWLAENASLSQKTLEVLIFEVGAELPPYGAGPYPENPLCYPRLAVLWEVNRTEVNRTEDLRLAANAAEAEEAKRAAEATEAREQLLRRFVEVMRAFEAKYNTFPCVDERLKLLVSYVVDESQRSEWRRNEEEWWSELAERARRDAEMVQKRKTAWAGECARITEIWGSSTALSSAPHGRQ